MDGQLVGFLQGFAIALPIYLWLDRNVIPWFVDHMRMIRVRARGT